MCARERERFSFGSRVNNTTARQDSSRFSFILGRRSLFLPTSISLLLPVHSSCVGSNACFARWESGQVTRANARHRGSNGSPQRKLVRETRRRAYERVTESVSSVVFRVSDAFTLNSARRVRAKPSAPVLGREIAAGCWRSGRRLAGEAHLRIREETLVSHGANPVACFPSQADLAPSRDEWIATRFFSSVGHVTCSIQQDSCANYSILREYCV